MTTVYWRKDDPDEFQVKDVNIPGVFPQPSLKINSSSVTTSVKPWLRPRRSGLVSQPTSSKCKHSTAAQNQGLSIDNDNQMISLQAKRKSVIGEKSQVTPKSKISASLKDLSIEDKKRVTNLIKELAKAGEERKLAVNALHEERTIFQGKEESLKRQQEKLISERDELREKILEYQLLINQYGKQIQHDREGLEAEERHAVYQKNQNTLVNQREVPGNEPGNLKPPLSMREVDEKIQTYYSIATSKDCRSCREIPVREKAECKEERSEIFVSSEARDRNTHKKAGDNSTISSDLATELDQSEKESYTETNEKSDIHHISMTQSNEKDESKVQRTLLEQQNKLLEQQKMIQEQLENLQMLQQKYAQEFSQIVTYSEDLKQALSVDKRVVDSTKQPDEMYSKLVNTEILRENLKDDVSNDQQKVEIKSNFNDRYKKVGAQSIESPPYIKHDTKDHSKQQGIFVTESEQHSKEQSKQETPTLDSYLNKSIEQIPGYLMHASEIPLQQKSTLVTSSEDRVHNPRLYHSTDSMPLNMAAHQLKPSRKHSSHQENSQEGFPLSLQHSLFPGSRNNSSSKISTHDNILTSEQSLRRKKNARYKNTENKQHSLLHSLEDIENELSYEDEDFINPGSYTGFARSILEGKFKNEQIFASTDYSDNESEPEDNGLIADMFFLKRS